MRFPAKSLLKKCDEQIVKGSLDLEPKDTAIATWSIARLNYDSESLKRALRSRFCVFVNNALKDETFVLE